MVFIGSGLALLAAIYLLTWFRKARLPRSKWFYRVVVIAGPAAVVALIAGWITTEVGRQPWIVYEVMKTTEAVTGAEGIPIGYATLAIVYLGLVSRRLLAPAPPGPPAARARAARQGGGRRVMAVDLTARGARPRAGHVLGPRRRRLRRRLLGPDRGRRQRGARASAGC